MFRSGCFILDVSGCLDVVEGESWGFNLGKTNEDV